MIGTPGRWLNALHQSPPALGTEIHRYDNRYAEASRYRLQRALARPADCELEVLAVKRELIEKAFG